MAARQRTPPGGGRDMVHQQRRVRGPGRRGTATRRRGGGLSWGFGVFFPWAGVDCALTGVIMLYSVTVQCYWPPAPPHPSSVYRSNGLGPDCRPDCPVYIAESAVRSTTQWPTVQSRSRHE